MTNRHASDALRVLVIGAWSLVIASLAACESLAVVQADYDANKKQPPRTGVMQNAVLLRYSWFQVAGGSGVLVGPRHVLTARHGVEGWTPGQLTIDLDDVQRTRVGVQSITLPEDKKIDLALLTLNKPVAAKPVVLLDREPRVGERVWLGGYGVYGPPGKRRGYGRFHAGYNRITKVARGRATVYLDKQGIAGEALPAAFDSGSPVWVETDQGWALSGITVTATGREGPDFGDRSSHQLVVPVREWLEESNKPRTTQQHEKLDSL